MVCFQVVGRFRVDQFFNVQYHVLLLHIDGHPFAWFAVEIDKPVFLDQFFQAGIIFRFEATLDFHQLMGISVLPRADKLARPSIHDMNASSDIAILRGHPEISETQRIANEKKCIFSFQITLSLTS
jgi:hypothetical protein